MRAVSLHAIKQALANPIVMSPGETTEFITKPIGRGIPKPLPSRGRGPKFKKNQYDLGDENRKRFIHRFIRLPSMLPKAGAAARIKIGSRTQSTIKKAADSALSKGVKPHRLVREIIKLLELAGPSYDETTIRRALKKLGYGIKRY